MRQRLCKYRVAFAFAATLICLVPAPLRAGDETHFVFAGLVKDAQGTPIAGAVVKLEQAEESISIEAKTDATGKFVFSVRNPGTYFLRVQKPGFNEAKETVSVPFPQKSCQITLRGSRTTAEKPPAEMQLSDNPDFTIAGITDWTAAGGHGSDTSLRTSEALAKQTRALQERRPLSADDRSAPDLHALRKQREQLNAALAVNNSADLWRELGDIDEQLNDPLAAEREYQQSTKLDPSERNYFTWATELLLHRAVQPALEIFTKGAKIYPHSERMVAGLGAALYASGLDAQAAQQLCAASDLNTADPAPYLFLGRMVQAASETPPCAEERLARFVHDQPSNAFANYYYALALWKRANKPDKSAAKRVESLLENAIAASPHFAEAYLQLGIAYAATGEETEAMAEYEKAIAANPEFSEAHFRLAQACKKSGELARAQQEFRTYEQIQKTEAAAVEQQRREIRQFVVVFKDQPRNSPN